MNDKVGARDSDLNNGIAFAEQTGRCILGMEACAPGKALLDKWWRGDSAARDNLAIRGIALNQTDILQQLAVLRDAAKGMPSQISPLEVPQSVFKQAQAAASAFGKANELHEQLHTQGAAPSVGLYAWYVALGRQVLRTAAPNAADHAMHHGLRLTLMSSVHSTAVEMRVTQAVQSGQVLNAQRVSGQVTRYLDQAWAESLMQAHSSDFYKVRASGVLCLLEGMLMVFKAKQLPESDARQKTELMAAAMTTAAAGFEVGASYVEQVATRYGASSVSGRGASVVLGRMKLWGAGLAGMGGFVLAWWDFSDASVKFGEAKSGQIAEFQARFATLLSTSYFIRAVATITLSLAELGTAIAIAKPFFEYLAQKGGSRLQLSIGTIGGRIATQLGTPAMRLLLARLVLGAFWIGLAITVVIWIFDDDALEKWCKRSVYRVNSEGTPFQAGEELRSLYTALSEVV